MEVTYVYLDQQERDKFSSSHSSSSSFKRSTVQNGVKADLPHPPLLNHRPWSSSSCSRQCQGRCNTGNLSGVDGRDPIVNAELLLNTTSRFGKKPALYWRGVVPYPHHSNLPEAYIYCMGFALNRGIPRAEVGRATCHASTTSSSSSKCSLPLQTRHTLFSSLSLLEPHAFQRGCRGRSLPVSTDPMFPEGVSFSGSFCAIFGSKKSLMPGLCVSGDLLYSKMI